MFITLISVLPLIHDHRLKFVRFYSEMKKPYAAQLQYDDQERAKSVIMVRTISHINL